MNRALVIVGAVFGLFAVLLGAFGAHGLEDRVTADRLAIWETAADYLGWHATTLLVIGLLGGRLSARRLTGFAGWCMSGGALIFSGSLFVLVLSGQGAWGAVTPIGGLLLALGWALLGAAALRGQAAADGESGAGQRPGASPEGGGDGSVPAKRGAEA
jgi:uncharacterized membrane protein YgdD (TMEM256/DUF423 family)